MQNPDTNIFNRAQRDASLDLPSATIEAIDRHAYGSAQEAPQHLSLNYVGTVEGKPGQLFHHALHVDHATSELMLIREGQGEFSFAGKKHAASSGDLIVYNQGVWHEEISEPTMSFRTVFINYSGLQLIGLPSGCLVDRGASPIISLREHYHRIESRFLEIRQILEEARSDSDHIVNLVLGVLVAEIVEVIKGTDCSRDTARKRAVAIVSAVRSHIHKNYNKRLSLSELGSIACVSPYHACRVFRAHTGYSLIEYLINYRIEVAKQYLRTTELKVATIAGLVGYRSETQFQAVFRKVAGKPPGRYRADCVDESRPAVPE